MKGFLPWLGGEWSMIPGFPKSSALRWCVTISTRTASLYQAFAPAEALPIAQKLEVVH
jgi:hypothetical protein